MASMAGLDDLYARIPTSEIASRLGVDQGEVDSAVHVPVPVLVSGLHQTSQDPDHASRIESAANRQAARACSTPAGVWITTLMRRTGATDIRRLRHFSVATTPSKSHRRWPRAAPATAICSSSCCRSCSRLCWPTSEIS
ncbi:hypothetical protein I551_6064 [Mycobacterium ulcerans str. Harvey]|uniref:Uncharacterized protein n=1 Tax=Mycobacterium ulcerans str. Harvey TaxID=1299332 RepID=A0ABP3A9Y8_MYCUL|nr:hypothetical protein I551_6064 [Mycobacterium ulcerans str. Harvey]